MIKSWTAFEKKITACERCPRLRDYCIKVAREKRRAFLNEPYWGRPLPGFGDHGAALVIIGLAPAAHGGNRTGRIFTGDRSGDWLFRALFKAGFANQPTSVARGDGLKLKNAYVTAAVKCAPPDNRPTPLEIANCQPYLEWEIEHLSSGRIFIALGKLAWDQTWRVLAEKDRTFMASPRPKFGHGATVALKGQKWLLGSYHPSQQNTFTGKLTEKMFDSVFAKAKTLSQKATTS